MKPLLLALQFLTRLPLPMIPADEADFGRAIRWFPVAGLVVGGAVAGAAWVGLHRDAWLAALLALAAWTAITGALHLDGLGDVADAAWHGTAGAFLRRLLGSPDVLAQMVCAEPDLSGAVMGVLRHRLRRQKTPLKLLQSCSVQLPH